MEEEEIGRDQQSKQIPASALEISGRSASERPTEEK